jgi:peroxiredoxin family protein
LEGRGQIKAVCKNILAATHQPTDMTTKPAQRRGEMDDETKKAASSLQEHQRKQETKVFVCTLEMTSFSLVMHCY